MADDDFSDSSDSSTDIDLGGVRSHDPAYGAGPRKLKAIVDSVRSLVRSGRFGKSAPAAFVRAMQEASKSVKRSSSKSRRSGSKTRRSGSKTRRSGSKTRRSGSKTRRSGSKTRRSTSRRSRGSRKRSHAARR